MSPNIATCALKNVTTSGLIIAALGTRMWGAAAICISVPLYIHCVDEFQYSTIHVHYLFFSQCILRKIMIVSPKFGHKTRLIPTKIMRKENIKILKYNFSWLAVSYF
jgi:hypothetical protein